MYFQLQHTYNMDCYNNRFIVGSDIFKHLVSSFYDMVVVLCMEDCIFITNTQATDIHFVHELKLNCGLTVMHLLYLFM